MYKVKVIVVTDDKKKYNITDMVEDVSWSGDENTLPRQVDVKLMNTNDLEEGKTLVNYNNGNLVLVYKADKEIFRGFIFKKSIDHTGSASFTAYDELIYSTKNNDTLMIKNKSASDAITEICKKFGIELGTVESTGYKIPKKVFTSKDLASIFGELLEETKKNTGKSFKLFSKEGKVNLISREQATRLTISVDDVISVTHDESIEELKNQVMVTKGSLDPSEGESDFVKHVESNKDSQNKYGTLQHIESADSEDSSDVMHSKAKKLLEELNKPTVTVKIDFIGDTACTTGNIIEITNELTQVIGKYYISSDSHSFSKGVHKMTLQLSNKVK